MIPNVLSIAGFDPSGGAGTLADIKTFAACRCHGLAVVTALTAQNTQAVHSIYPVPPDAVAAQIDVLFADSEIAAVKIGMLASSRIVEVVAERLARYRGPIVVLDPVLAASSGDALVSDDVGAAMLRYLAPLATLVTPNVTEAAQLAGSAIPANATEVETVARRLHAHGFKAVLVKGGHMAASATADDLLFDGTSTVTFSGPWIATQNTHGTGCTLSAAVAAGLAHGSMSLAQAIDGAKAYVADSLAAADGLSVGRGHGPLHHFHRFW